MAQITLRGIKPQIEKEIRKRAKRTGKSINRVVLEMIDQNAGGRHEGEKPPAHSLKELAGSWSEHEAQELLDSIRTCRQIDEEMWK
ncbi:MAG: hypothetical protein K9K88_18580 [Desulfobacterales bacterium]|nr:hypothetical protein [Desulfobacterales bacterium]